MEKQEAIKIITTCAQNYKTNLENKNLLFIFGNQHKAEYFETLFLPQNFIHLTGIESKHHLGTSEMYEKILNNKFSKNDFGFKSDGTAELKISILSKIVQVQGNAKMIGEYNNVGTSLYTEKIAGNVSACLGFVRNGNYYVPNTALKEDIRKITIKPQKRILAVLRKPTKDEQYKEITYLAKGINFEELHLEAELKGKIHNNLFLEEKTPSKKFSLEEHIAKAQAIQETQKIEASLLPKKEKHVPQHER